MKQHAKRPPIQQGRIDGLCAIYSVLNATRFLFNLNEKQDEKLFQVLCAGTYDLFPDIVWDGTGVPSVHRLLAIADRWTQKEFRRSLKSRATPTQAKFSRVKDYFARLRGELAAHEKSGRAVWIVGLGKPWDHWTVADRVSESTVWFYDSWGMGHYRFDSFTFDKARAGEGKGKKIMIDAHQSFLVWRED